ncbi:hypothetical protein E4U21_000812 [Claviceps maximensis]|nr:hypothetical protein E4U21_000812 [Claviceps maximensis]
MVPGKATATTTATCQQRSLVTRSRSYEAALEKLTQLQSNREVTGLFDKTAAPPARDLNAAAVPEMLEWLHRAGYSPKDLSRMRHIHVAGTKGKGSVCAFATAMLREYDVVGTYTSPHLVSPRERITINGKPLSREVFAAYFFDLWDRFTESAKNRRGWGGEEVAVMGTATAEGPASKPFFFRFLTILAWHVFLQEGIRSVVMECGIGGEYDATNVLPPEAVSAAVVTHLGVDHVAMLGDTVEQIAWHKAGIFKSGVRAFAVNVKDQACVMDVLRARAEEKGAVLVEVEEEDVEAWAQRTNIKGNLQGGFQKQNQALAFMAVKEHMRGLLAAGLDTSSSSSLLDEALPDQMARALATASLRGRCEVLLHQGSTWLLDGAHTQDSLEQVAKWAAAQEKRPSADIDAEVEDRDVNENEHPSLVLLFNQQERDAPALLKTLVEALQREMGKRDVISHAVFTRNELQLPLPLSPGYNHIAVQEGAAAMMKSICPACRTTVTDNVVSGVEEARKRLGGRRRKVLVTGSLHLVGGVMQVLEPDSALRDVEVSTKEGKEGSREKGRKGERKSG